MTAMSERLEGYLPSPLQPASSSGARGEAEVTLVGGLGACIAASLLFRAVVGGGRGQPCKTVGAAAAGGLGFCHLLHRFSSASSPVKR